MNVVGYSQKKCCNEVESNPKITKYPIGDNPFNKLPRKLFLLYAPFKVLYQVWLNSLYHVDSPITYSPSF